MSADWTAFTEGLTRTLAALPVEGVLIVTHDAGLVQFLHGGAAIRAETGGSPSADGRQVLLSDGWEPPPEGVRANWSEELPWPATSADYRRLAERSVRALRDAYGIPSPDRLHYEAWINGTDEPFDPPGLDIARVGAGMPLPPARTSLEAHIYLDLHPCPTCGETAFARDNELAEGPEGLLSRYRGPCDKCGRPRLFTFRLTDEVVMPVPGRPRFGGDTPSALVDPGEWLLIADSYADQRRTLPHAAAAVDEVLKFVPRGGAAVPPGAFWTRRGREAYDRDPERFTVAQLAAARDRYRGAAP
jgi:hypothetical protein